MVVVTEGKNEPGAPLSAELASGRIASAQDFDELGALGLESFSGYIRAAYNAELYWPTCFALYDRIRRSDPEVALIRLIWGALGRQVQFHWELQTENPTDDDLAALEFAKQVLDDIEGGMGMFRDTLLAYVPFMGWGVWEIVAGKRDPGWSPPDGSEWRSQYSDGRIGIRKLAFRDHSSFQRWEMDDATGRLLGMVQMTPDGRVVTIPVERMLHVTFGDVHNPEGLSPLEAVWRLERIKYGLEVVQGIGFEHAAGHVKFSVQDKITEDDKALIRKAARAMLTAQEGNYVALPEHIDASIEDTGFAAADAILEAIRYYGLLKLQVFNMQWVSIASTAGTGAYSAMADASTMFLETYNAMMTGFAEQVGRQLWDWIVRHNDIGNITTRPRLVATPVEKTIDLAELADFMTAFSSVFPMSDEDVLAIRRKSRFLPAELPQEEKSGAILRPEEAEMSFNEQVWRTDGFAEWARENRPEVYELVKRWTGDAGED